MNTNSEPSATPSGSPGRGLMGWLCIPLRLALGGIFIWAGYEKITHPQDFVFSIKAFKTGLPDWFVLYSAFMVPWLEVVLGVALIIGLWLRAAAVVTGGLLVFFCILIIRAILAKSDMSACGCFGEKTLLCASAVPGWCHVGENCIMLIFASVIGLTRRHAFGLTRT